MGGMDPTSEQIAPGLALIRKRERRVPIVWALYIRVVLFVAGVAGLLASEKKRRIDVGARN
jgi:hypothetical protein